MEVYDKTSIFIPMNIMEDVVESVAQKVLRSLAPSGTNLDALQWWVLNYGRKAKKCVLVLKFLLTR